MISPLIIHPAAHSLNTYSLIQSTLTPSLSYLLLHLSHALTSVLLTHLLFTYKTTKSCKPNHQPYKSPTQKALIQPTSFSQPNHKASRQPFQLPSTDEKSAILSTY
mmetsp:Transcript_23122/g.33147  ORF Transcript_23122/g.33147 Transcript_23122/m.33147 type:complete len:106 (+) Transcript_23122:821-1138(+)